MKIVQILKQALVTIFVIALFYPLTAQMAVDINFNMKHEVGGISDFDRKKFMVMHASLDENEWDSNFQRQFFLENYDVYLGRNNGKKRSHHDSYLYF